MKKLGSNTYKHKSKYNQNEPELCEAALREAACLAGYTRHQRH